MMGVIAYLRGEVRLRLTGASPERCLNALTRAGVEFWGIEKEDELHCVLCVLPRDARRAERIALRCGCEVERLHLRGLRKDLGKLLRRPVLALGLLAALGASFFLPSFVWVIEVQGNETVHTQTILRALEDEGIRCGTWAAGIPYNQVRNPLLNRLPQLSWIAVNRSGGKLSVLVAERRFAVLETPDYPAAHIVAARDGVLTDVSVLEGMRLCSVGDTVRAGQMLVSGFEDQGIYLRAVCAQAEIYGQTWHKMMLVMPSQTVQKRYTGREWTHTTLIVGRKRIKICGNSGILDTDCDKMISVKKLTLPGYSFPVTLETEIYREYESVACTVDETWAEQTLSAAYERLTLESMVAGRIVSTESTLHESGGRYTLTAESTCTEMLARLVPAEAIFEGEQHE